MVWAWVITDPSLAAVVVLVELLVALQVALVMRLALLVHWFTMVPVVVVQLVRVVRADLVAATAEVLVALMAAHLVAMVLLTREVVVVDQTALKMLGVMEAQVP